MSGLVVDAGQKWTVVIEVGEDKKTELLLYQVTQDIYVEAGFSDRIRQLILENQHYLPGANVTSILTPEREDCVDKALFLVICFLKDYAKELAGTPNHYLLGEMRDKRFRLVAAADKGLTNERFKFFMKVITRKPELVRNLVLAHHAG